MRGLEGRQNPFQSRERLKGVERLPVVDVGVLGATERAKPGMFRPDRRVVEPCRDRMGRVDVAVLVLQHVGARALKHSGAAARKSSGVTTASDRVTASLDANQANGSVGDER